MFDPTLKLVLASGSPRRRDLLGRLGVEMVVRPAAIEERLDAAASPSDNARRLALEKAQVVAATVDRGVVLGADTLVVLDAEILGKPDDAAHAVAMFGRLCGRAHEVITGLALVDAATGQTLVEHETTRVTMRGASHQEIERYVATGESLDKAGAYGAQGFGAIFIERVDGCFYNVVGLPLARLHGMLERFRAGAVHLQSSSGEDS